MTTKSKLMTQAEYARHRGWSRQYVSKAVKLGLIPTINGKIDPKKAEAALKAAADPARGGVALEQASYSDARAMKERYRALLTKLEYDRRAGELTEVAEVKQWMFKKARAVRDAILGIPDRIAPILAAETDAAQVHALLMLELRQALEDLANDDVPTGA